MKGNWIKYAIWLGSLFLAVWIGRMAGTIDQRMSRPPPPPEYRGVLLINFAGIGDMPFRAEILETRPGYIRVRLENGREIIHSGNYSILP